MHPFPLLKFHPPIAAEKVLVLVPLFTKKRTLYGKKGLDIEVVQAMNLR
jgi:hypothetical protein